MIPIRDTIRSYTYPFVTWALIALNTVIFIFERGLSPRFLDQVIFTFGMVPARLNLTHPLDLTAHPQVLFTLMSSMFLHAGWLHLISNMWSLFIFGDNVEDRLGHGRFLLFYVSSGVIANLLHALVYPGSPVPAVGASGAIAGVLGAYFLLFPRARIVTLIPIFFFAWFIEIPAVIFMGFWFISQLYSGVAALGVQGANLGGVAWWAHVGGFLFGLFVARQLPHRRKYEHDFPGPGGYPWQ